LVDDLVAEHGKRIEVVPRIAEVGWKKAVKRLARWGDSNTKQALSRDEVVRQAACDVWVIPYVGLDHPIPDPSVLMIHDLVPYHFPGTYTPEHLQIFKSAVENRVQEAALCACMSNFIRGHDLMGELQLPAEKARSVRPAAPTDFPELTDQEAARLKPPQLQRSYLFYPAAFRLYKNHVALVECLHVLRERGEDWADVVFTGITEPSAELSETIHRYDLADRVHILGKVDRATLGALYKCAFATVVPTLYEQGSFPVYEAIHWQCPVAASDIPPLREQCQSMGDAMLYFDPYSVEAIADSVVSIRKNRDGIQREQWAASRQLWERTWDDVAAEWIRVYREVADMAEPQLRAA
jgi:glycosyltransferase involved in cell wall biosynthesis